MKTLVDDIAVLAVDRRLPGFEGRDGARYVPIN